MARATIDGRGRELKSLAAYAKYEGEGHAPPEWSYPNQLDFTKRMTDWFDEHLRD